MFRRRDLSREGDRWNTSVKPTGTPEILETYTRSSSPTMPGSSMFGVAITMADQSGNTLGTAVVQVKDFLAVARSLEG